MSAAKRRQGHAQKKLISVYHYYNLFSSITCAANQCYLLTL
ncbi:MAG: hypothetical protein RML94_16420 [Bacteroidia bacterium]|nr:hypothetical protein [Bacteroidia bacterium]